MLSLIFGGCCSNVFALESIIKVEPASGMFSPPAICAANVREVSATAGIWTTVG
jgi:hypothetical protein